MISENLFESILVNPSRNGLNTLNILSGYASATMATKHIDALRNIPRIVNIELIVGMCVSDGMVRNNHTAFKELSQLDNFKCFYLIERPQNHSKIYLWKNNNDAELSFNGSANYTQNAFSTQQIEAMASDSVDECLNFYNAVKRNTIDCRDERVEELIQIYDDVLWYNRNILRHREEEDAEIAMIDELQNLEHINVSFLDAGGNLPERSGLNWGQREGREPNQAYIRLPVEIYRSNFFPPIATHFTLITDDNKTLICTRAQQNGKAIHTPLNNSLIGEYFRNRLGIANGAAVLLEHLTAYGRNSMDFYKIDEETYYMDFSRPNG